MTPPQTTAVVLRHHSIALDSEIGKAFISDCARHTEGLFSEGDIKNKWGLSDDAWRSLEQNGALTQAVRRERECCARNGAATAEAASLEFAKAPSVLGGLLTNQEVSPRHRMWLDTKGAKRTPVNTTTLTSECGELL